MKRKFRGAPLFFRLALPSLLAGTVAGPAPAQAPALPTSAPAGSASVAGSLDHDAELSRRLDSLLAAADPGVAWSIAVEMVGEKDRLLHRTLLWSGGIGIWDGESQFRLEARAQQEILKAFRDQGFCQINDELYEQGSGGRKSPNVLVQEQAITLEIGGMTKTVTHVVSTSGRYPDVEEAARPLLKIVNVVRMVCEGPAAKGIRATDLADGLSKVAGQRLADVALKVFVNRPEEAGGSGLLTRVDGKRVTTQVSTKGKGWAPPVELRLSSDDFLEFVRTVSAAAPGAFPQNLYDEGYTDLTISVLNRSVNVQARPFSGMDPKAHEEIRKAYRTVVAAVRKLHEKALREGKRP
jgi:hypothetical protein